MEYTDVRALSGIYHFFNNALRIPRFQTDAEVPTL